MIVSSDQPSYLYLIAFPMAVQYRSLVWSNVLILESKNSGMGQSVVDSCRLLDSIGQRAFPNQAYQVATPRHLDKQRLTNVSLYSCCSLFSPCRIYLRSRTAFQISRSVVLFLLTGDTLADVDSAPHHEMKGFSAASIGPYRHTPLGVDAGAFAALGRSKS